jgi:hypothetical protein
MRMFFTPSKSLRSTDHCAILPKRSDNVSFGTPPPDVKDDVELSSEQETGGELRRRLEFPSATGKERRRLLRLDLLPPLFRFLLELCKYAVQNSIHDVNILIVNSIFLNM